MLLSSKGLALTYTLPANGDGVVGQVTYAKSLSGETLFDVGRRFDIGYYEMADANPNLNPDEPLSPWTKVKIPSQFILPPVPHKGIVINLAELRLYYYPADKNEVITLPMGIGRVGWDTPLGESVIRQKVKDPTWHPPVAVRQDAENQGYILPQEWPPGPDNPLGTRMLRLGWTSFLIHGTNQPSGVGKRSSAGCMRMFPEDVEALYDLVPLGTPVRVVNNPIKVGWQDGSLLLEAHKALQVKGKFVTDDTRNLVQRIEEVTGSQPMAIEWRSVRDEIKHQTGVPVRIANHPMPTEQASVTSS